LNLFYQPNIQEGVHYLDPVESNHSIRVMRMKAGDRLSITDGKGFLYHATITVADAAQCTFVIRETVPAPPRDFHIHIGIAPTKNVDRLEWFVEKAVEFGIDQITFMRCDHSERTYLKTERMHKIAVSAMKQSIKFTLPVIGGPVAMSDLVKEATATARYIAHSDGDHPNHLKTVAVPAKDYLVLIGPEGDFSPDELELAFAHQFQKVSLGTARLRTETAGIAVCHLLNLINTPD